jgi:hypothetical protein
VWVCFYVRARLADLSTQGARIEHFRPLPEWTPYVLDIPRALGGIRLQGEVLWSRRAGRKRVLRGKRLVYYQSGLIFRWLTPAQRAGLVAALDILKGAQED